jgi:phosphoglycolate phosphatase
MTVCRHVVWDWNGTLLDDAWLCLQVINALLVRHQLPEVDARRYSSVFGFPLDEYCRRLGFVLDRPAYEKLSDAFSALYEPRRLECSLRRGTREALEKIRALGVGQSVLSAYTHQRLEDLVGTYALTGYFGAVVGAGNEYGEGKVELGRKHLELLRCAPGEVLVVGDTLHDLEVARAMGADCALLDSGHQHAGRLRAGGARVVDSLDEVVSLVAGRTAGDQRP